MARSVPECLKLQLVERNRFDPAMAAMLDNLELLARRDLSGLRAVCGVDAEDLSEMIAELKASHAPAWRGLRRRAGSDRDPRCSRPRRSGRRVARRAEHRHPAASAGRQALSRLGPGRRAHRDREDLRRRLRSPGQLAGQVAGPARQDHPQGRLRDRAPAGRLPGLRRRAPAAAEPEDRRRRHRHARNQRSAASPRTNTSRRRAACSS